MLPSCTVRLATGVDKKNLHSTAEVQAEERTLRPQPYAKIGRASLGMTWSITTSVRHTRRITRFAAL